MEADHAVIGLIDCLCRVQGEAGIESGSCQLSIAIEVVVLHQAHFDLETSCDALVRCREAHGRFGRERRRGLIAH